MTVAKQDLLTEWMMGQVAAVRCIGKFVIAPRGQQVAGMELVMMIGSMVSEAGGTLVSAECEQEWEMWECEVILLPRRKYSGIIRDGNNHRTAFAGMRADQILCSDFGNPDMWGDKYFDINDGDAAE